ncbi:MAG TPA: hypothetical protein VLA05_10610 [Coriobacteriia bacterium]|nr:hypothetical protein [Coriobacteriia bacterium]
MSAKLTVQPGVLITKAEKNGALHSECADRKDKGERYGTEDNSTRRHVDHPFGGEARESGAVYEHMFGNEYSIPAKRLQSENGTGRQKGGP